MKLYYIANARMPTERAHGIQIAKMCEAFVKQGIDLELIVPARAHKGHKSVQEFYGLEVPIKVRYLPVLPTYYLLGKLGFWIGSASFMVSYLLYMWYRRLKGGRALGYSIDMDQMSVFFMPLIGMPYFIEIHDAKPRGIVFAFVFKFARGVITINNIIKKKLCERFYLPQEKVLVYPNAVDSKFFENVLPQKEARAKLQMPQDKKIVLYAGQFYAWKGLEIFTEVAKRLPQNTLIYLVGGTPEEFTAVTGIKAPFPAEIVFVNKRPFAEVPFWLAAADTLVVLGTKANEYSYYHTSPMKLFDYMTARRPIIAGRTPAIEDIVSDDEVLFYEPDDAADMAARIAEVVNGKSLAKDQAEKLYIRSTGFTWDKRAAKIREFIRTRNK